jgi:hypothetical protein
LLGKRISVFHGPVRLAPVGGHVDERQQALDLSTKDAISASLRPCWRADTMRDPSLAGSSTTTVTRSGVSPESKSGKMVSAT